MIVPVFYKKLDRALIKTCLFRYPNSAIDCLQKAQPMIFLMLFSYRIPIAEQSVIWLGFYVTIESTQQMNWTFIS